MRKGTRSRIFLCGIWGLLMTVLVLQTSIRLTIGASLLLTLVLSLISIISDKSIEELRGWLKLALMATLTPLALDALSVTLHFSPAVASLLAGGVSTMYFYRWFNEGDFS